MRERFTGTQRITWEHILLAIEILLLFLIGFVPFIPLDLVKSIVAAQIVPAFKNIIKN